jgi:8-oxo-dGTP diphosphatase
MKLRKISLKARLILYDRGKILLLKQTKPNGGNYTLVGGTVDKHETARQGVIRESFEEAGLIINKKDLKLVHVLQKIQGDEQRLTLYFKAYKWEGTLESKERKKFKKVEWFDLDELPPNMTATVKHVLTAYRHGILYSELEQP